jgi:hypothetical protein
LFTENVVYDKINYIYESHTKKESLKENKLMKYGILLGICLMVFSCGAFGDCKTEAQDLKEDECLLVVRKIPIDTDSRFDFKGINPITDKECDCNSKTSDRWWTDYKELIEIGDTIIKKRGQLIFNIHKKDTILTFDFECNAKIYK